MNSKRCSKCGGEYPADRRYFQVDMTTNDGLSAACKPCRHAYDKLRDAIRNLDPDRRLLLRVMNHNHVARRLGVSGILTVENVKMRYSTQCGRCWHCGVSIDLKTCDLDHLIALSLGGANDIENVVCACRKCNRSKSNRPVYVLACRLANRGVTHPAAAALSIPIQARIEGEMWN